MHYILHPIHYTHTHHTTQIHHHQKTMEVVVAEERKRKNYADFWNIIPLKEPYRVILSDIRDRLVLVG